MRTSILITVLLGACLTACTSTTSHTSTNSVASSANAAAPGEVQIMSQDECDLRANDSITAANCDSEFDKLVREIEADQSGGG